MKGVTKIKPVIFGNVSHYFGKKRETDGHTHGWTVFLRPFKNEVSLNVIPLPISVRVSTERNLRRMIGGN